MPIKLKTLLSQTLQEQDDKLRVDRAYDQTIDAVKGLGTNTNLVLNAIKMLNNRNEFIQYTSKFSDKKTGYSDFSKMINSEYDRLNRLDADKLVAALRQLGVTATYNDIDSGKFYGGFVINWSKPASGFTKKDRYIRKKQWLSQLPRAVAFWKSWLSDPITKQRVQKNWDSWYSSGESKVNKIWPEYYNMLDTLHIVFYDNTTAVFPHNFAYAYVSPPDPIIHVNLDQEDPAKYDTLVHEIQHIIYGIKPLNPERKIKNVFVTKDTKKDTEKSIKSSIDSRTGNKDLDRATYVVSSLKLDMKPKALLVWKYEGLRMKNYSCAATEKMSNIMAMRNHFNLKPGQNVTLAMLKPYIERKKRHTDISWLLRCWSLNNFPNINTMINRINMLAKNDIKNKQSSSGLA